MKRFYKLDEWQAMRAEALKEHKLKAYTPYKEETVWTTLRIDRRSFFDWKVSWQNAGRSFPGRVFPTKDGRRSRRVYLGLDIADLLILGKDYCEWVRTEDGISRLVTGSSDNVAAKGAGSDANTTNELDKPDATALARKIIKRRAKL